jgi:hypothetical protein
MSLLDPRVKLTMGMLSFKDTKGNLHSCPFQFNPETLERSRTIEFTRTPTGNILDQPRVGPKNQAKRKFTRKTHPWDLTLSLRYDATYCADAQSPPTGKYKDQVQRVTDARQFFESLVEAEQLALEHEKVANADETPPPPIMTLQFGIRSWRCAAKSVRIKELDYTPDLYPRRFEVTLQLEVVETTRQNDQGKLGAEQ